MWSDGVQQSLSFCEFIMKAVHSGYEKKKVVGYQDREFVVTESNYTDDALTGLDVQRYPYTQYGE